METRTTIHRGPTGEYFTRCIRELPYAAAIAIGRTIGLTDDALDSVRRSTALVMGRGLSWALLRWDGGKSRIDGIPGPKENDPHV